MKKNVNKNSTALILTILMVASTFTACSQANRAAGQAVKTQSETAVTTMAETEESTINTDFSAEMVTAETSPVSDETQSSTTAPSKPKKSDTSQSLGNVGRIYEDKSEQSESSQTSQNKAPAVKSKTESKFEITKETTSKAAEKSKSENKPKVTEKPKTEEKSKATEKPTEKPAKKTIDFNHVTSALIAYGKSLGMVNNSSLNISNGGWFPPLDVSGYSDTDSVISAGYGEVDYVPYYFSGSGIVPSDIAFNVIVSNKQIYVVYG